MNMENKDRYLLITGASSGIGRCIAANLSTEFRVILSGRNEARLREVMALCTKDRRHLLFLLDLTKVQDIESSLSAFMTENNIEISQFVHCAGFVRLLPLRMTSLEVINTTLATNFLSAALLTKVLIQRNINHKALESVVFVSSNISNFGAKAFGPYAASKAALDSHCC